MIAEIIERKVAEYVAKQATVRPARTNWASSLWHPCDLYLVFRRTRWQEMRPTDPELQAIFMEGNSQELATIRLLQDAGIRFVEQQVYLEWPEYEISGMIDGTVEIERRKRIPADIKSISPWGFKKIRTKSDVLQAEGYVRGYALQIGLYMLMKEIDMGLLIFKDKTAHRIKAIEFTIDDILDIAEEGLKKAQRVNQHVHNGTFPDPVWIPSQCPRCPFRHICPVRPPKVETSVEEDAELIEMIMRRQELKPLVEEYKELDEKIKARFKERDAGEYLVGSYVVRVKKYTTTSYDIPKEIKQQYAVKKEATRVEILETAEELQ